MTRLTLPRLAVMICALALMTATPAHALEDVFSAQQEAVENPGGGMKVVTPLKDCLDKLPPEDAEAVRRNYLKPYQECHLRLQALGRRRAEGKEPPAKDGKKDAATDKETAEKEPPPAESPRNFVRVRKDDGPRRPARYGDIREPAPQTRPRPEWDSGYNR